MPLDSLPHLIERERTLTLRGRLAEELGRWWPALGRLVRPRPVEETFAFSAAVIALAAKMAKADGVAVKLECETFERFFEPAPQDLARIRRLYRLASQDTAGFEHYAASVAHMLREREDLKISVLECLLMIACADGMIHPAEEAFLRTVGQAFGFSCDAFRRIKAPFVRDLENPYDVLGLDPSTPPQEVRQRYLELVQRFHPDRLIAAGAQAPIIKAATIKLAAINAAYESIAAGRRLAAGEPA